MATITRDETIPLSPSEPPGAAGELAAELRRRIKGEVRFDNGSRALYAADASNYRQTPIGVVIPRDEQDVIETIAVCRQFKAPVLSRGGGTSLAGQCCNFAVVMDHTKYFNRLIEVDPERKQARVQPGLVLDTLRDAAEKYQLTFGPDPATHNHCTLGGMIGNNSCGMHAQMAGRTAENVHSMEIVTYDGQQLHVGPTSDDELDRLIRSGGRIGQIYASLRELRDRYADRIRERFPNIPRRVSGYCLEQLLPENGFNVARALVGSEGTLVTIREATLRLIPSPQYRALVVIGYEDIYKAGDAVKDILPHEPIALEGMDDRLIEFMQRRSLKLEDLGYLPKGDGWLIAEFGGDTMDEADGRAHAALDALKSGYMDARLVEDKQQQAAIWEVRESGLGATAFVPGMKDTWPGWEDSAVPPDRMGDYLRQFRHLLDEQGYGCSLYGHFGQGCLHVRIDFDLTSQPGIEKYRSFVEKAADLVVSFGGSLSGEHGDGQSRAELLPKMYGAEIVEAFREFKGIWDPDNRMNPGKVVMPYKLDENLRLGSSFAPSEPKTHFNYESEGSFSRAMLHCVGIGNCRRDGGGTMCPSFMVTHEEMHSTRGRAHLLFEMLRGETITGGWKDESVKEALDLCLACKGCKGDCPVNVDMATYKAEFLSHYYDQRLRPRQAYFFGLIFIWARLASYAPWLANFSTRTPLLRDIAKKVSGTAPKRTIPKFAGRSFKDSFRRVKTSGEQVILWPDTFNNYFHADVARAAASALTAAGFDVTLPEQTLCCGRPLYDYGMLPKAKRQLQEIIEVLREPIRAGRPIVVLEPSCLSVFRDEMVDLFPQDQDAARLSRQVFSLAEFLLSRNVELPKLSGDAIVQGHCHQKSILGMKADEQVYQKLGLDIDVLESGCCGMAGSFGFEDGEKYDVSIAAGERVLLPAVRNAPPNTLILADGFSCQEQIDQLTPRHALHLAQVLDMAYRQQG